MTSKIRVDASALLHYVPPIRPIKLRERLQGLDENEK